MPATQPAPSAGLTARALSAPQRCAVLRPLLVWPHNLSHAPRIEMTGGPTAICAPASCTSDLFVQRLDARPDVICRGIFARWGGALAFCGHRSPSPTAPPAETSKHPETSIWMFADRSAKLIPGGVRRGRDGPDQITRRRAGQEPPTPPRAPGHRSRIPVRGFSCCRSFLERQRQAGERQAAADVGPVAIAALRCVTRLMRRAA